MPDTLSIDGFSTLPVSVAQGQREADELLRVCRKRIDAGDGTAILWLLDLSPEFIRVAWVRDNYVRLAENGRLRRRRGRPVGRDRVNPMVVVGLVEHLKQTERAGSRDKAFGWLEEMGLMTYASAKDAYYRALSEPRFKPIFLEFPEGALMLTDAQAARWLNGIEVLKPGRTITRKIFDPRFGLGEIDFVGL